MKKNKPTLSNATKYLVLALPLLFIAPLFITIGFKALKSNDTYLLLSIGIFLAILAISVTAIGIVKIGNVLFHKDDKENEDNEKN